jgi:hypothetical protein
MITFFKKSLSTNGEPDGRKITVFFSFSFLVYSAMRGLYTEHYPPEHIFYVFAGIVVSYFGFSIFQKQQ